QRVRLHMHDRRRPIHTLELCLSVGFRLRAQPVAWGAGHLPIALRVDQHPPAPHLIEQVRRELALAVAVHADNQHPVTPPHLPRRLVLELELGHRDRRQPRYPSTINASSITPATAAAIASGTLTATAAAPRR